MNVRLVFKILLRRCGADGVFDIGSCNGRESLMFRQILPRAAIVAFEANPINHRKMVANPELLAGKIEIFPYAITNTNGTARFNVSDVDYDNPNDTDPQNAGSSSLLVYEGFKVKEAVAVETRRIDEFVLSRYPELNRICLWIDVEGVEFQAVEGMIGIKDRVLAVHVETARVPLRMGQKLYPELKVLMESFGFVPMGTNMSADSIWGDVLFVNDKLVGKLGWRFRFCQWVGELSSWRGLDSIRSLLMKNCAPLYRFLWRLYVRLFT